MTIIRSFWCCWGRRPTVLASRPFSEIDFDNNKEKNGRRRMSHLNGTGVEGFLESMEIPPSSLGHCLFEMFGRYYDRVVEVNAATGEVLKYKDILAEALALAAGLRSLGVTPGKLIGLLAAPNDAKVNTILVASLILGAVLHPIDYRQKTAGSKLATLLQDKQPRIVFCAEEQVGGVAKLKTDKTLIVSIDGKVKPLEGSHPVEGTFYFNSILKSEEGIVDLTDLGPQDVLVVLQGNTKNEDIALTNEEILRCSTRRKHLSGFGKGQIMDYEDWSNGSWIIRRIFIFRCGGGTLTALPPFESEQTLALVQKHRISWVALKSYEIFELYNCQAIVGYDLSSLQIISAPSSGSALHPDNATKHDSLRERLPATRVVITGKTIADAIPT